MKYRIEIPVELKGLLDREIAELDGKIAAIQKKLPFSYIILKDPSDPKHFLNLPNSWFREVTTCLTPAQRWMIEEWGVDVPGGTTEACWDYEDMCLAFEAGMRYIGYEPGGIIK